MEGRVTKGIVFSGEMVRAILDGRKTVTRRVVAPHPHPNHTLSPCWGSSPCGTVQFGERYAWRENGPDYPDGDDDVRRCPYGVPGDRLWLREAHSIALAGGAAHVTTLVDGEIRSIEIDHETYAKLEPQKTVRLRRGRPGRFMPRWASRILLEVVSVRIERLQEIDPHDVLREGIEILRCDCEACSRYSSMCTADQSAAIDEWMTLWDSINGKRPGCSWDDNPWVWRVEFRRLEP